MAVEIFLKIDGVTGESKANGHVDEIEVFSFSLGASNPSSVAYGHGSGAGKVDISSLSIQKQVDNASAEAVPELRQRQALRDRHAGRSRSGWRQTCRVLQA